MSRAVLERQEEEYWRQYSGHKQQLLLAEDEYRSLDCQLRHNQDQLNKLKKTNVFNATFHIWHSGHFGTINGFRCVIGSANQSSASDTSDQSQAREAAQHPRGLERAEHRLGADRAPPLQSGQEDKAAVTEIQTR